MNSMRLVIAALLLALASSLSLAAKQDTAPAPPKSSAVQPQQIHSQEGGDRIFKQNCSRCHAAPEGFSPRISGTILRHMRVRASLSQHDAEELLRFLNP